MRLKFLVFFLILLVACAAPPPTSTPIPTLSPTATSTPTPTPTLTPTPIPTPLPHPAAFDEAFARRLIRYENGQWLVSVVRTADGGRQTVELILLPDTFATHDDLRLKNPLAPYTVRALDENGQELTLIWNPEKAEFRLAYTFPALFEGVGSENPRLIAENLEKIPFIPIEDIQSGLAVQSLLAHILERMDQGESLADILYLDPEAVRQNWQKLGGNSLLFELLPDGKVAWLKAKGNDQSAKELRYDNMTMKILPLVANLEINGANYSAFYMANFDPIDPQNPDPEDLSNWKFFLSFPFNQNVLWEKSFSAKAPLVPYILLYGDEKYQQNHPLLAQLLSIEGNDAHNLPTDDGNGNDWANISGNLGYLDMLDTDNRILETQGMRYPLPPQLQQMILLFEVGVAQ